jgi:hypothetical protein
MPEDYFDDAPQNQVGDKAGDGMPEGSEPRGQDDKEGEGDEHTALINSEICPDMKTGDVIELRIKAVHQGEYEVQYEPKEKGDGEGDEPMPEKEAAVPDAMMD